MTNGTLINSNLRNFSMTFLTDIKTRDHALYLEGRSLHVKGLFKYLSPEDVFELMRLVTDSIFKNHTVMTELLSEQQPVVLQEERAPNEWDTQQ
jgi:hypothetical protein